MREGKVLFGVLVCVFFSSLVSGWDVDCVKDLERFADCLEDEGNISECLDEAHDLEDLDDVHDCVTVLVKANLSEYDSLIDLLHGDINSLNLEISRLKKENLDLEHRWNDVTVSLKNCQNNYKGLESSIDRLVDENRYEQCLNESLTAKSQADQFYNKWDHCRETLTSAREDLAKCKMEVLQGCPAREYYFAWEYKDSLTLMGSSSFECLKKILNRDMLIDSPKDLWDSGCEIYRTQNYISDQEYRDLIAGGFLEYNHSREEKGLQIPVYKPVRLSVACIEHIRKSGIEENNRMIQVMAITFGTAFVCGCIGLMVLGVMLFIAYPILIRPLLRRWGLIEYFQGVIE